MIKPKPINIEKPFNATEVFFSTTNLKGHILFGNDVFVRISGYERDKLIGSPHNIIRHPEMPSIVFKILWQTIQAKKMIVAYVKNLAADGEYYWVLAVVFPIGESYLSIRIKPSTQLLPTVESIYKSVLDEEQKNGIEASSEILFNKLNDAGFSTYESFMKAALTTELAFRDQACLNVKAQLNANNLLISADQLLNVNVLSEMSSVSENISSRYRLLFKTVSTIELASKDFVEQILKLSSSFLETKLLSMKMHVFSGKNGAEGASMIVIAKSFGDLVDSIENNVTQFSQIVNDLGVAAAKLSIDMSALKVQIDAIDFFVRESISKVQNQMQSSTTAFAGLKENSILFLELFGNSMTTILKDIDKMQSSVSIPIKQQNHDLRKFVNSVDVIGQMGAIEFSRFDSKQNQLNTDFESVVEQMKSFAENLRQSSLQMNSSINLFEEKIAVIGAELEETNKLVLQIFSSIKVLSQQVL